MSWRIITDDWRLKLLALGLAVLMLGAVAFSQNPPTLKTLSKGLSYNTGTNPIVLINPPSKATVTVTGLSSLIAIVNADNLSATVDASHAKPGLGVRLDVTVTPTLPGITVQQPPPIVVDIDTLTTKEIPVEVRANAAPGWSITNTVAMCPGSSKPNPCAVHFTGPASWMTNLHAYVAYPNTVSANSGNSPNQPVLLQNNNGYLDMTLCRTTPCTDLDVSSVSIHVDAVAGSTSSTVALLDLPPTHGPANGYRVTAITITPNTVIISGDPVALGKVRNIVLPAVDLSGRTSDATFPVSIPYPDGISSSVATASIKYSISPNPSVSPSPGP
ncbi:MAG TPA: CdaR family protein [Candidatus Limnocylindrales bacterium]|nr:CdaR family protein [Candidatus Limnocylindrales bacterium]